MNDNFEKSTSREYLDNLVAFLMPAMAAHNFEFTSGQNAYSSGGPFANGFFVNKKARIGIIFRNYKLGLINYESTDAILSHDMLLNALNKTALQKLYYNSESSYSYGLGDLTVEHAFLQDLQNIILPYFDLATASEINALFVQAKSASMGHS